MWVSLNKIQKAYLARLYRYFFLSDLLKMGSQPKIYNRVKPNNVFVFYSVKPKLYFKFSFFTFKHVSSRASMFKLRPAGQVRLA